MTALEVLPVYAVIDYTWELLKANTGMTEAHYNGRIPIIPSSQQPEFTQLNRPFIVYAWGEDATSEIYKHRHGTLAYAIYSSTDRDMTKIANIIATAFGEFDISADRVNRWTVEGPFQPIRFTYFNVNTIEGPTPEDQEGGRQSAVVMIKFGYITEYDLVLP